MSNARNNLVSEIEKAEDLKKVNRQNQPIAKMDVFRSRKATVQSPIQRLVNHIAREVNREKHDYEALKYIFRSVREKCEIEVTGARKKLIELPTKEEINQFFNVIKNPTHKLIFETLNLTGLRISELCNLKVEQIDFEANTIFVKCGKGGKDRVTILPPSLAQKLLIFLQNNNNIYLFESSRGTKFSKRRIQQMVTEYTSKAGVKKRLTCHSFRHLWNTRLAEAGVSREAREILAGHAKGSKSQDIYTHLSVGAFKRQAIEALEGK